VPSKNKYEHEFISEENMTVLVNQLFKIGTTILVNIPSCDTDPAITIDLDLQEMTLHITENSLKHPLIVDEIRISIVRSGLIPPQNLSNLEKLLKEHYEFHKLVMLSPCIPIALDTGSLIRGIPTLIRELLAELATYIIFIEPQTVKDELDRMLKNGKWSSRLALLAITELNRIPNLILSRITNIPNHAEDSDSKILEELKILAKDLPHLTFLTMDKNLAIRVAKENIRSVFLDQPVLHDSFKIKGHDPGRWVKNISRFLHTLAIAAGTISISCADETITLNGVWSGKKPEHWHKNLIRILIPSGSKILPPLRRHLSILQKASDRAKSRYKKTIEPITGPLLTTREAACLLRVTPSTIRRWIKMGKIRAIRPTDRRLLIPSEEIWKLMSPENSKKENH